MHSSVPTAKATVGRFACGTAPAVCQSCSNHVPGGLGTPSMAGICPVSTWMPTPVRNPMSTGALRKSPMNPSRSNRARSSMTAHMSATRLVQASQVALSGRRPTTPRPARPEARTAAVAESAPTTSSRDDPSSTNASVGKMIV